MSKPGPKPMIKPAWPPADDLTEMQRRFVDFLAYRQGRSTFTKAAIEAGYSEKRANREGSELMKNPKVQRYYRWKCNQINRSQAVNHTNYLNQPKQSRYVNLVVDLLHMHLRIVYLFHGLL